MVIRKRSKIDERVDGKTKAHKQFIVNFAMAYGGQSEIVDATKKIAEQVNKEH